MKLNLFVGGCVGSITGCGVYLFGIRSAGMIGLGRDGVLDVGLVGDDGVDGRVPEELFLWLWLILTFNFVLFFVVSLLFAVFELA